MPKNVQSIIDDLQSGLTELRMHFESLGSIFGGEKSSSHGRKTSYRRRRVGRAAVKTAGIAIEAKMTPPMKKTRKKMTMSPALRAQRKLQGRYMALIKHLPKAKQAQVKKVRKDKGYEAALKMMG